MRYLDRASVTAPICLSRYNWRTDSWDKVKWAQKEEIRAQLRALQRGHCAYCECDLPNDGKKTHVEHFEQRERAKEKTYVWNNLFWSCLLPKRCGVHKDKIAGKYDVTALLKPDVDDPRRYLRFTHEGEVSSRTGLDDAGRRRAEETIRVFALNQRDLVAARKAYLAGPYRQVQDVMEARLSDDESRQVLDEEAQAYEGSAFSAAILDVFGVAP